ncbi:1-deoxyxylulose-5-phosphate synthase YajO-like [Corticium candelabrum]|uniref:1-deoxyxylulose-5-phosphate synthase YajO-like n=1 Tax=Corticium candelabrum TaxID=121492 RepID=UPI002E26E18C|nr:1-deoxyxylulose-5-phosphate synthase YajO-like [Corticium candelabrum]XP_062521596.1 1-deoxyxylulose-5-phosphate synthase YajO-like [Corticium candelabrum]
MTAQCGIRYIGNCGLKVTNICLGAMTFGERKEGINLPGQCDETASHALLDKFVEMGGNFVDTADSYSGGKSEQIIGTWLQKQEREKIVLATKVRFTTGKGVNDIGLSRKHIMFGVEQSLKHLQTHYIDLYQVHGWDDGTPIEEWLSTLNDLVRSGKVRYLGLSNVTGWQLQKIIETTKTKGYEPFSTLQIQYSLLCREIEWELQEVCRREGLGILPWSPLKGGYLTGKIARGFAPEDSRVAWSEKELKNRPIEAAPSLSTFADDERVWKTIDSLEAVAAETSKSMPQIALKWLLQQDMVSSVIIGAKKMEQLVENMGAGDDSWTLSEDQLGRLNDASAVPVPYPYSMVNKFQNGRRRRGVRVL